MNTDIQPSDFEHSFAYNISDLIQRKIDSFLRGADTHMSMGHYIPVMSTGHLRVPAHVDPHTTAVSAIESVARKHVEQKHPEFAVQSVELVHIDKPCQGDVRWSSYVIHFDRRA